MAQENIDTGSANCLPMYARTTHKIQWGFPGIVDKFWRSISLKRKAHEHQAISPSNGQLHILEWP